MRVDGRAPEPRPEVSLTDPEAVLTGWDAS